MPRCARRDSSAADHAGSTVEHITKTLPGSIAPAQPPSPNRTVSVWAALITTLTITSHRDASSAGEAHATPPSAAKVSATPGRTSTTWTRQPARRSERAIPPPIAPSPITPTLSSMPISYCGELILLSYNFGASRTQPSVVLGRGLLGRSANPLEQAGHRFILQPQWLDQVVLRGEVAVRDERRRGDDSLSCRHRDAGNTAQFGAEHQPIGHVFGQEARPHVGGAGRSAALG